MRSTEHIKQYQFTKSKEVADNLEVYRDLRTVKGYTMNQASKKMEVTMQQVAYLQRLLGFPTRSIKCDCGIVHNIL